jgi:hypothetical protein
MDVVSNNTETLKIRVVQQVEGDKLVWIRPELEHCLDICCDTKAHYIALVKNLIMYCHFVHSSHSCLE